MVEPLRHRQTKGAETDMLSLTSPRHTPTLPTPVVHRNELVMPAAEAGSFRSWLSGQTQGGAQGGGGVTHNHHWNVSAIDSRSFIDALQIHSAFQDRGEPLQQ